MGEKLSRTGMGIYTLLFAAVMVIVRIFNTVYIYNPAVQGVLIAIWCAVICTSFCVFKKHREWIVKNRYRLLAACALFLFALQIFISSQLVKNQMYDCGKVVNGAIYYVQKGKDRGFRVYDGYLHHYTAQMGEFLIVRQILKIAAAVGIEDFYGVLFVTGHLLFSITLVCTFFYLEENFSSESAVVSLFVFLAFAPFYFQSSVPYTDTFSIWAPPAFLLFASRGLRAENMGKKAAYCALASLLIGLGMQVKVTAGIAAIAFLIQVLVNHLNKRELTAIALSFGVIFAVNTAFTGWKYSTVLEESRKHEDTPITHWIMMGLQGDGTYNSDDEWVITGGAVGTQAKIDKNIEVIKERLAKMGPKGYARLIFQKTCATFGCGNRMMWYNYLYRDECRPLNLVYNIVLENGRYNKIFNHLSQSFYVVMNILGVLGGALMLLKKDEDIKKFAPFVALIGFYIFMMLWESNCRQLVNQWSLYAICAAVGYTKLSEAFIKGVNTAKAKDNK